MKELLDRLPPGLRVSVPVLVSAAAFGVSAYVVTIGVRAVIGAAFESSVDEESANPLVALEGDSSTFIETSRRRFEGRSMYALPPAPVRRPKIVEQPKPVEPPKDPGPPPPPSRACTGPNRTDTRAKRCPDAGPVVARPPFPISQRPASNRETPWLAGKRPSRRTVNVLLKRRKSKTTI